MAPCVSCGEPLAPELEHQGFALHPTCEPLPLSLDMVASEVFGIIADALINQPRSLQKRIGPSEIGIPCDRRIAYILADTPRVNAEDTVKWKPAIGTAIHDMFDTFVTRAAMQSIDEGNAMRWHTEQRVTVGEIGGVPITGSCDLFDAWSGVVIDYKSTSRNAIREKYRPHGPGDQYRVQAHLYGRGWQLRGFTVREVGFMFVTRDGEFVDRHVDGEPYDEQVALDALQRANDIHRDLADGMPMQHFATADAMCRYCPWFRKGATQLAVACPGHPTDDVNKAYPFDDLLPQQEKAA